MRTILHNLGFEQAVYCENLSVLSKQVLVNEWLREIQTLAASPCKVRDKLKAGENNIEKSKGETNQRKGR